MNKELNRQIAPEYHQITKINIPTDECGFLANKMPYHVLSGGSQEIVVVELMFNAGVIHSNQLLVASTANTMLVSGTRHHTAQQIADTFDFYGAELRTDSNFDHAAISLFCLNKYLDKLLPLLCELIEECVYPETELKTVLTDRKHKFIVNQTKTAVLANNAMHQMVYGAHPYGRHAELIDYDRVTSKILQDFHAPHYCAANCRLMVAGYVTDQVMQAIEATIGKIKIGAKCSLNEFPFEPIAGDKTQIIKREEAVQSSLRMGLRTIKMDHPDYHKLNMLTMVLGGYFGSRLMTNIRKEKGYTYGIYSRLQPQAQSGLLCVYGDIKSGHSLQVANEVRKEMQKLKDEPISDTEMALVRNYMMGELLQIFDGPFNSFEAVSRAVDLCSGIDYFDEEQATILNTQPADLQAIANKYFDLDNMVTAIAGNE